MPWPHYFNIPPPKIDHDVCSNYGNWLYSAGIGNDPRENRKFNMIKQGLDYDSNVCLRRRMGCCHFCVCDGIAVRGRRGNKYKCQENCEMEISLINRCLVTHASALGWLCKAVGSWAAGDQGSWRAHALDSQHCCTVTCSCVPRWELPHPHRHSTWVEQTR